MERRTVRGRSNVASRTAFPALAFLVLAGCNGEIGGGVPVRDAGDGTPAGRGSGDTGGASAAGAGPGNGGTTAGHGAGGSAQAGAGTAGAGGAASTGGSASTGGGPGTGGGPSAAVTEIRIVGRTSGDAKSPRFEWPSVSIQARFKGTRVEADLDGGDNNYFEVVVDGAVKPKVSTTSGRRKVPIVSGLADAEHDLVIWRRTEANNFSPSQFFGLDFGTGTLLPITAPSRRLEVIGDSITCGYGDEGAGPGCSFSFEQENSYVAYGAVLARELGADVYTEAWSGKGMYRNNGGDMTDTIPTIFQRAIPTENASTWDFSWKPDAVVVNLGTNDFAKGDPGQPFANAYESFAADLRTHYPNAYVFLVIGPMLSGDSLTKARAYLDEVVKVRKDAGDTRIQQIQVDAQDQKNGIGCDWHPSKATHDLMGKALAAKIKPTLGW